MDLNSRTFSLDICRVDLGKSADFIISSSFSIFRRIMSPKKIPTRFLVTHSDHLNDNELILRLESTFSINDNVDKFVCILRDFWKNLTIEPKEFVNIYDPKIENNSTLIIDNLNGLIIVRPDVLIPITTLMAASFCMRKAWLSRMFEIIGEPNKALLIGTIVHEIFQECFLHQQYDVSQIENIFLKIIPNHTLELYGLNMTREDLMQEVKPYIRSISNWFKIYVGNESNNYKKLFSIQRLHDVENTIWSTKYGFIGKIDLSLEVIIEDKNNMTKYSNLIPLELKTGRHSFSSSHMGQVILYSFIMTDKYVNYKSSGGYLLYLKDDAKTEHIPTNHNVFRDLILLRNKFVRFYDKLGIIDETNKKDLVMKGPATLNSERTCRRCEHNLDCSLIYRCFDQSLFDNPNDSHFSSTITAHLKGREMEFFSNMLELLEIERQFCMASEEFVDFWNFRSEECEKFGIGLSKMKIKFKDERTIIFHRNPKATMLSSKLFSLNNDIKMNLTLLEGRRAVISEELINSTKTFEIYGNFCRQLCIMIGQIESFSTDTTEIIIKLEKDACIMNPQAVYRIDFLKNISNRAMLINFSNLLRLMYSETDDARARELREIIIHGRIPKSNMNGYKFGTYNQLYNSPILSGLNIQQKRCILGILKTKCSLIFGSPGSGKTQTIVSLIQILVEHGYSILVTSYTHVAVDNILMKLVRFNDENDKNVDFVRMGPTLRINPQLLKYSDHDRTKKWLETENITALNHFYSTIPVVAATCLGVFNHPLFQKRTFDFCIIDEASQVFLCTSLGPLFNCHNFVLVGDQKQLPPVVQSPYARQNGLDESLFSRLLNTSGKQDIGHYDDNNELDVEKDKKSDQSIRIFPLFIQYRMNSVIMQVANKLTYDNQLKCANKQVETISLSDYLLINDKSNRIIEEHRSSYLSKIISPDLNDSVIFIDTSSIESAFETSDDDNSGCNNFSHQRSLSLIINENDSSTTNNDNTKCSFVINKFEARLILHIVRTLLMIYSNNNNDKNVANFNVDNIGIISPFRRQVNKIRELFGQQFLEQNHLEINTVDQYQGRDKDVIIYSCVKSCSSGETINPNETQPIIDSELLKDERRLNVAVTRAKRKLIIIGNCQTLKRYLPFRNLFNVLESEQFIQLINFDFNDIV
ncbi:DNA replication ATP-dependent helicase/nuclease DNA2-like [Dermatophagoides pteronyssinus]|uniref:DNA replication ATP-dependent helicase/nuclease DNA2-like n=1 Tax=Dermatophagoides pteronyssinus TaxID=6956 RepID=UPI003F66CD64